MAAESEKLDIENGASLLDILDAEFREENGDQEKIPEIIKTIANNKKQVNLDASGDTSGSEDMNQNKKSKIYGSRCSLSGSITSLTSLFFRTTLANHNENKQEAMSVVFCLLSVLFYCIYQWQYTLIEDKIDKAFVVLLRGGLQVVIMLVAGVILRFWYGKWCFFPIAIDEQENANVVQREGSPMYGIGWLVNGAEQCSGLFFSLFSTTSSDICAFLLAMFASTVAGSRLAGLFQALKDSSLGNTNAIMNSSPLFVMIIGVLFLREKLTIVRLISFATLIAGCILTAIPKSDITSSLSFKDLVELQGIGMAAFTMFLSALGICLFKPLSKRFHKVAISFYYGVATVIVGLILIFVYNNDLPDWPSTPEIWMKVAMVALFGVIQQFFIIAAVSKGSPVQVAMIRTIGIVFSFVLQTQNNEASPTMYAYGGAAVIAGTAFLMTFETKIDKILESYSNCPST